MDEHSPSNHIQHILFNFIISFLLRFSFQRFCHSLSPLKPVSFRTGITRWLPSFPNIMPWTCYRKDALIGFFKTFLVLFLSFFRLLSSLFFFVFSPLLLPYILLHLSQTHTNVKSIPHPCITWLSTLLPPNHVLNVHESDVTDSEGNTREAKPVLVSPCFALLHSRCFLVRTRVLLSLVMFPFLVRSCGVRMFPFLSSAWIGCSLSVSFSSSFVSSSSFNLFFFNLVFSFSFLRCFFLVDFVFQSCSISFTLSYHHFN